MDQSIEKRSIALRIIFFVVVMSMLNIFFGSIFLHFIMAVSMWIASFTFWLQEGKRTFILLYVLLSFFITITIFTTGY